MNRIRKPGVLRPAILLALLLFWRAAPLRAEGEFRFEFQPTFLSGSFGTPGDTEFLYLPLGFRYRSPRLDFLITVPYLRVRSTGDGVADSRFFQFVDGQSDLEVSGLGDVTLKGELYFLQGTRRRPWISAIGRVKLPTAETESLGTGEMDAGGGVGWIQPLGRFSLFSATEYILVGDPPGVDYRDVLRFDFGAGYSPRSGSLLYLSYYNRDSIVRGREDITDLTLGWQHRVSPRVKLLATIYAGLSDTAEDWGFSLGFVMSD